MSHLAVTLTPAAERALATLAVDDAVLDVSAATTAGLTRGDWSTYAAAYERLQAAGRRAMLAARNSGSAVAAAATNEPQYAAGGGL